MIQLELFGFKTKPTLVPFDIPIPFDAHQWLSGMIRSGEHMIFLFGQNPHICQARCCSSWESCVTDFVARAWVMRQEAERSLLSAGYTHHSNYSHGEEHAKVFIRR